MTRTPALVAFDLDDTLAESKSPIDPRMAQLLTRLLDLVPVCIISGGRFEQFRSQVLDRLDLSDDEADRLHLMPTCGTRYLRAEGGVWVQRYANDLSADEKSRALAAVEAEARRLGLWREDSWGPILEDRGSQITYSALGQSAPVAEKQAWDPDGRKKSSLRSAVAAELPDLEVRSGGSTSIDITHRGIDKAYGMRRLSEVTGIDCSDMLFVGDRLDPDGNDYPVIATGTATHAVTGWRDTADYLAEQLIPLLSHGRES
ncbi:HAD-IIB family hydrolase [Mycetocola reblochoni]|uniref:phosphomannomutase n=2 Tax=Mycetocola reblochoni TaxID=331618 RepID=A0A1R4JKK2_9MICO|nr:HAD-IIB family hydrolase [Mycetocola reblochoni]RLP70560.1 HAD-IIB family hydrolase [Mycetocola reblochoni]SJN32781.1 Phosphomannomutase [Mycetocola reblochoni REB411]